MNIFFDTSSLLKLYHFEPGTAELRLIIQSSAENRIFISEIALIEMHSAVYKKLRTGELDSKQISDFFKLFENDIQYFTIIPLNKQIVSEAQRLLIAYGTKGLRTLDAIQLASAVKTKSLLKLAITHDKLLKSFFSSENINTQF